MEEIMQKLKRALAFLFSLVMVIGLFTNAGLEIEASTNNTVTIYYNNSSWSQAYIHYQQANGTWTNVPGERMTATSEVSGYKWKATINLGSKTSTQVCFNDGNNNWDSRNGANYTVSTGTCGIKNGSQETIHTATPIPTPELFTCDFSMDKTSPQIVGTTVKFTGYTYDMPYHMYNNYAYTIHKQGTDASKDTYVYAYTDNSTTPVSYLGSYKFTESGTYDITFGLFNILDIQPLRRKLLELMKMLLHQHQAQKRHYILAIIIQIGIMYMLMYGIMIQMQKYLRQLFMIGLPKFTK